MAERKGSAVNAKLAPERVAELLADVDFRPPGEMPEDVCKRYDVSLRTLTRYRNQEAADPVLAELVRKKKLERAKGWRDSRLRFLRNAINRLDTLVANATGEQIREVAGAIKIVGDLESLSQALSFQDDEDGQQSRGDRSGQAPAADARRGAGATGNTAEPPVH
jgi:hypothetical protein